MTISSSTVRTSPNLAALAEKTGVPMNKAKHIMASSPVPCGKNQNPRDVARSPSKSSRPFNLASRGAFIVAAASSSRLVWLIIIVSLAPLVRPQPAIERTTRLTDTVTVSFHVFSRLDQFCQPVILADPCFTNGC